MCSSLWNVWRKKYACLPRIINTYITRLSWLLWWGVCVCVFMLQRDWSVSCKSCLPSGFYPWPKSCLINGPALLNSKTPLNFESFSLITPSPRAKAQGNSMRPGEYKTREPSRFLNKRIWQTDETLWREFIISLKRENDMRIMWGASQAWDL